jgi:hypothetical protein
MRILFMTSLTAALAVLAACGSSSDEAAEPPAQEETLPPAQKETLPPAPPEALVEGKARLINLYRAPDGATMTVDVWSMRTAQYRPVLLAEKVGFGEASGWFQWAKSQPTLLVPAGAGPDATDESIGRLSPPGEGEHVTATLTHEPRSNRLALSSRRETAPADSRHDAPAPPPAGKGMLIVCADPLSGYDEQLRETYGGRAFHVGDGQGACLRQRAEDEGKKPVILGGTARTTHDLSPGKHTVALHRRTDRDCADDPVFTFEVEIAEGAGVLAHLYTRDAETLETLIVPTAHGAR